MLIFAAGIASPVVEMIRLHPYQYTYFNHLIGGVAGARPYFMVDYWGLSMTQASRELSELFTIAARSHRKDIWTVAVCGPHPNVAVNLGPKFEAIWDPKGADFAMMLEEFYCADLDAPDRPKSSAKVSSMPECMISAEFTSLLTCGTRISRRCCALSERQLTR